MFISNSFSQIFLASYAKFSSYENNIWHISYSYKSLRAISILFLVEYLFSEAFISKSFNSFKHYSKYCSQIGCLYPFSDGRILMGMTPKQLYENEIKSSDW